jgi:hypothetical protein
MLIINQMIKVISAFILGLALTWLAGCRAEPVVVNETAENESPNANAASSDWQTYENSRYAFSVEYPAGWILAEAPVNNDGRTFTATGGSPTCSAYGFYNALVDEDGNGQSLEDYVADLYIEGEEVISETETALAGESAYQLVSQDENGTGVTVSVYILGAASGRALTCTFPDEQGWEDFQADFTHMRESFQVAGSLDE